ncbi:MAG: GyrI-like domain-containing protein [Sphaerochaeta sp.]|nr:GyrI-like domain-containing protein [Sphaerochaeta sp.]
MEPFDRKKQFKSLYSPKTEPSLVTVPPCPYFVVEGEGSPLDEAYDKAVELLFQLSYTLKMEFKDEPWYREFVVSPLEGLWSAVEVENMDTWRWASMIAQPPFVNEVIFSKVAERCSFAKGILVKDAKFKRIEDGLCVTMMHVGPYSMENRSFARMDRFSLDNRLQRIDATHREIYLSSPKIIESERLKTVLRFRVERI